MDMGNYTKGDYIQIIKLIFPECVFCRAIILLGKTWFLIVHHVSERKE